MSKILKKIEISPTLLIVICYFSAVIISTLLLSLPICLKTGVETSFLDTVFTAVSGISVTGLTVVNTADTFSFFGIFVLMVILQFGGIGIMTLGTLLWIIFGRNIGLSARRLIMVDQNRNNLSGLVKLMKLVLAMALIIEAVGTLIFGFYFWIAGYYATWYEAFYYGLFHALSSYTNAGFDIFGDSMMGFSHDYFVQIVTMALLILGAIGFPVLIEVREYLFGKNHKRYRFSLYTKVTTSMFFLLLVLGALGIFLLENQLYYAEMSWHQKLFYSLFNSVTARNGGLATMDVADYSGPTQFLISALMFIGASPSSVGGGIRTTTFALIVLVLISYALGHREVRIFNRSITQQDIIKSFVVFSAAMIIVATSILIFISISEHRFSVIEIIFEISSAFGTTGLSMGITGELYPIEKIIIIILMFIGRIGILSLLFMFRKKKTKENYHYPSEDVIIS